MLLNIYNYHTKSIHFILFNANLNVIKCKCFTKVPCLEGIRRNQTAKKGINDIHNCKSFKFLQYLSKYLDNNSIDLIHNLNLDIQ